MKKYLILIFFCSSVFAQGPDVLFFPMADHITPVFTWEKQPNSGAFYSKVDESTVDPTVDIEYVYSSITDEPVVGNKKLKLLIRYANSSIFSFAKFPNKILKIRCEQTSFDGNETFYVSYTPAVVNNNEKLVDGFTDNIVEFGDVECSTSGFATVELDLGIDYNLPVEANGAILEFRWETCSNPDGCTLKISSVSVLWDSFRIVPMISE